ncbi:Dol-P-Man:Man(7)GlcNAc(2)-PP-Dol alpha-1,6-mannosyltransferase ALG12 [Skeletonema marinoi]|uniref:Mannosyltransferase n=1 Tax=Skeletonema marinoi TaxID=267567 RepID=A0AAD8YNV8_9STRA|nr:Dol-P-Man:Man(7)GlcNAc(2)-PP-Dol alpha-1,6-mannosyltransferase ALG12 [Skeletonema marinoi]
MSRVICPLILLLTGLLALVTCPHSKVEESFNLQATHDIFYHGVGPAWRSAIAQQKSESCSEVDDESSDVCNEVTANADLPYDHLQFPGVVARTFTGAFVLSSIARIISVIVPKSIFDLPSHPMAVQFLIRFELLILSWLAHVRLASSLDGYFAKNKQVKSPITPQSIFSYYLLITASQFHIPFYSSRLLPNTFALLLTTHAYAEWFNGRPNRTAIYLVFTTAIFRCDVLLLLFTVGLTMLIRRELRIVQAVTIGIVTGIIGVLITAPLDSVLWQRMVWPEFEVWWFNAVDNRSSEWGVMPFHWYFSNALPKGLLLTMFLVPLAFLNLIGWTKEKPNNNNTMIDHTLLQFFIPTFGFVVLYSFLPHKEMRFIFPALPMFNACAAYGLSKLHVMAVSVRKGAGMSFISKGLYICGLMAVVITMIGSLLFLRLSMENYPGGAAMEHLKNHFEATTEINTPQAPKWEDVHVHIDVAAAMTGVSLFGQRSVTQHYPIQMSKSGYEAENDAKYSSRSFTHLLSEEQSVQGYHVVDTIEGFPSLDKRNLRIVTNPAIYILERDGWLPKEDTTRGTKRKLNWYYIAIALSGFIIAATLGLQKSKTCYSKY